MSYVRCVCGAVYDTVGTITGMSGCCPKCGLHYSGQYRVAKPVLKPSPLAAKPIDATEIMIEHTPIEYYINHVMDEITKHDVERVSEKLRALGWEEVVRCRECKKWDFMYQDPNGTEWGECAEFSHSCGGHFTRMNGFCYWGERRNESLVEFIEREGRKRDTND